MAWVSPAALVALVAPAVVGNILECAPGFGYQDGVGLCSLCAAGRWGNGNGTCVECSSGRYSGKVAASEAATCEPCPLGRWAGKSGLTSTSNCESCPTGRYSVAEAATTDASCQECPAGTYSTLPAATSPSVCQVCGAGRYGEDVGAPDRDSCKRCPAGKWSDTLKATTKTACNECPVGTFLPGLGATKATSCAACPPGEYGNAAAASKCLTCPKGTWNSDAGMSTCQTCPQGRWPAAAGAQSVEDCLLCEDQGSCSAAATVLVAIHLEGVNFAGAPNEQALALKSKIVSVLADAAKADKSAVMDAVGQQSSVSLNGGQDVQARIGLPAGVSPADLALALSELPFTKAMARESSQHQGSHPVVVTAEVRPMEGAQVTTTAVSTTSLAPRTEAVTTVAPEAVTTLAPSFPTVPPLPTAPPIVAIPAVSSEPVTVPGTTVAPTGNETKNLDVVQMSADSEHQEENAPWIEGYSHLKWWIGFVCLFTCIVTVCVFLDSYESERKEFLRKRFGGNRRHQQLESDSESPSSQESAN